MSARMIIVRAIAASVFTLALFGVTWYVLYAAALTRVSDLISTSAPSATSTHVISFTATQAIPPSGRIRVTLQPGGFDIPADFDYTDIDLAVSNGGPFADRSLAAAPGAAEDGATVVTGSSGSITFTLSSTEGIAAGEKVQIELGGNATFGETGDAWIENPGSPGSYRITIATEDAGAAVLDGAQAMIAIVQPVSVTLLNENVPPGRLNGLPSGEVAAGNERIEISLETNEIATCRYSLTPGVPYGSMTDQFTSVGGQLFYTTLTGFQNNTTYSYYVRCRDFYDAMNLDDYEITFSLAPDPISDTSIVQPGSEGNTESDSEGPFPNGVDTLYRSKVTLSGLSSPQSSVVILKDGVSAGTAQAGSNGAFSATVASLERGSYTFLAYALDRANRKTASYASTISLTQGTNNSITGIVIPPTIGLEREAIAEGEDALVQGEAVPGSAIEVSLRSGGGAPKMLTATARSDGMWELPIKASDLPRGVYRLRARAVISAQLKSDESAIVSLGVGENPDEAPAVGGNGDINGDGKVNLVDFSIMLSAWGTDDPASDLNADGVVNLADFSILLFNWTG